VIHLSQTKRVSGCQKNICRKKKKSLWCILSHGMLFFGAPSLCLWCCMSVYLVARVLYCITWCHVSCTVSHTGTFVLYYCITYRHMCLVLYHIQAHVLYGITLHLFLWCYTSLRSCYISLLWYYIFFLSCSCSFSFVPIHCIVSHGILSCSYLSLSFFLHVSLFGAAKYCVVCGVLHVHCVVCFMCIA